MCYLWRLAIGCVEDVVHFCTRVAHHIMQKAVYEQQRESVRYGMCNALIALYDRRCEQGVEMLRCVHFEQSLWVCSEDDVPYHKTKSCIRSEMHR